jgi:hypothetical protein
MVITSPSRKARQRGALMAELLVAMAIFIGVLLPIAYSLNSERRLALAGYQRAVAMEIVDGETEVLVAGAWRNFPTGTQEYPVQARAAANLSPGKFLLTLGTNQLRLEWRPADKHHGGPVVREITLP